MSSDAKLSWLLPRVSPAAPAPLYQQIIDGLKREIGEGRLTTGTPLPSFRALAEELLVSVITVKRAYEELERDGIIYRKQGLGTFVAQNGDDRSRQAKVEQARRLFREGRREASEAGLNPAEILSLAQSIIQENGGK